MVVWTQAKVVAVLATVGADAQGFFSSLSQQVAAWIPAPTKSGGISQAGSPPIGGSATYGGGIEPSASGTMIISWSTMIISWSTQYFTVTTGYSDSSQTGPITDGGGIVTPIPTGGLGSAPAPVSGTTYPSEFAPPSPDIFVIEIGPAGGPSESGAPGSPIAHRQGSSSSSSGELLTNAGVEKPAD
jgi:hypothetical protein